RARKVCGHIPKRSSTRPMSRGFALRFSIRFSVCRAMRSRGSVLFAIPIWNDAQERTKFKGRNIFDNRLAVTSAIHFSEQLCTARFPAELAPGQLLFQSASLLVVGLGMLVCCAL